MRKRWVWAIVGAGVLAVGVLAVVTREREPVYEGRKLSEWAKMYMYGLRRDASNDTQQAVRAIHEIGTNAIPYLEQWRHYDDPQWEVSARWQFNRIMGRINPRLNIGYQSKKEIRSEAAFHALIALDNEMGGAEEISRLFDNQKIQEATNLFVSSGLRTQSPAYLKVIVCFEVGLMGTNAISATHAIEDFLTDSDVNVRKVATNALRRIRGDTNLTSFHK